MWRRLACSMLLVAAPAWAQNEAPMAQAENAFAVDLYGKLAAQPGNLFFSPYSISTALEMVLVGARGGTAEEIGKALHLGVLGAAPVKADVLFPGAAPDGFKFNSANALWCAKGYHFTPDYLASIKGDFGGDARRVNFNQPDRAAGKINGWVAKETQGKIQDLISPEALSAQTRLVLTNAVYFKAGWASPFDVRATDREKFHVAPDKDVMTEMMHQTGGFDLVQADGARILSIPYRGGDASLVIILPNDPAGLAQVEANLTADELDGWLADKQYTLVALTLPRIQDTQEFGLNQVLMALGIELAFDPGRADLTGIANNLNDRLYVSDVLHKANVDIDEKGTQAAAATAIVVTSAAIEAGPPPVPVPFVADHPFIYLIRSNQSGDLLFMGRVEDPTQTGGA